jgi:hypothetical protein
VIRVGPGQSTRTDLKNNKSKQSLGVTQVIECLPSNCESLSQKKKKKKKNPKQKKNLESYLSIRNCFGNQRYKVRGRWERPLLLMQVVPNINHKGNLEPLTNCPFSVNQFSSCSHVKYGWIFLLKTSWCFYN